MHAEVFRAEVSYCLQLKVSKGLRKKKSVCVCVERKRQRETEKKEKDRKCGKMLISECPWMAWGYSFYYSFNFSIDPQNFKIKSCGKIFHRNIWDIPKTC